MRRNLALAIMAAVCCGCASQAAPTTLDNNTRAEPAKPVASLPDSIWKRCSGIKEKENTDRIRCGDVTVFVFRSARSDLQAMMDDYIQHNARDFKDSMNVHVEPWKVGAAIAYRYELTSTLRPNQEREISVVAIAAVEGGSRMVACTSRSADMVATRCRPFVMDALVADSRVDWGAPKAPLVWKEGTFVGRELQTAPECERKLYQAQNIDCGPSGQLSWHHAEQINDGLADLLRRKTIAIAEVAEASHARLEKASYPCVVEGVAVTCTESSMYLPTGEPEVVFVQAIATVRKQQVYVLCSWQGANITHAPKPCDEVLDLKLRRQTALSP